MREWNGIGGIHGCTRQAELWAAADLGTQVRGEIMKGLPLCTRAAAGSGGRAARGARSRCRPDAGAGPRGRYLGLARPPADRGAGPAERESRGGRDTIPEKFDDGHGGPSLSTTDGRFSPLIARAALQMPASAGRCRLPACRSLRRGEVPHLRRGAATYRPSTCFTGRSQEQQGILTGIGFAATARLASSARFVGSSVNLPQLR